MSFWSWVGEHGPDWIQAVAIVYAAWKVADWVHERRATHRSEIATEAIVAALGVIDAWEGQAMPMPVATLTTQQQLVVDRYAGAGVLGALRLFQERSRAAEAVLTPAEIVPLVQLQAVCVGAMQGIAKFRATTDIVDAAEARSAFSGDDFLELLSGVRANVLTTLQPIARLPEHSALRAESERYGIDHFAKPEAHPPQ